MSRQLRIEYAGSLHHITSRGNARADIHLGNDDRRGFLVVLAEVCEGYRWRCHSYCLMSNYYHLLVGHVSQGRYKSIIVDKDAYLLELCRHIVLNPVRAQMVRAVKD